RGKKTFDPNPDVCEPPKKIPDPKKCRPTLVLEGYPDPSQPRQNLVNQSIYHTSRIRGNGPFSAADDNGIYTKGIVLQQTRHRIITGSLHFEIGKSKFRIFQPFPEGTHVLKQVRVTDRNANASSLRRKKTRSSYRITTRHSSTNPISKTRRALHYIGPMG